MGPVNQSVTLGHITSQTARPLRADKSQVRQHLSCPRPPWCRRRKRHWTWRVVGGGCWRCRRTQRHVEPIRATVRCRRRRAGSGRHATLNSAAAAPAASTETPDKHRQSAVRYNVCVQNVVVGAPTLRRRSADVAIIPCILLIEKCTGEVSQSYVSLRHRDAPLSENQHAPETGDKPMTLIRGSVGGGEFTQAGGEIGTDNQSSNVPTEVEEIQGERESCVDQFAAMTYYAPRTTSVIFFDVEPNALTARHVYTAESLTRTDLNRRMPFGSISTLYNRHTIHTIYCLTGSKQHASKTQL